VLALSPTVITYVDWNHTLHQQTPFMGASAICDFPRRRESTHD
jgi:hypothetical protein